ncbi:HECT-type E3 ubiquitin transferase [Sarracenia purpurea var. burkii]
MWMTRGCVRGTKLISHRNGNLGLGFIGKRWISTGEERANRGKKFAALWGNGDYGRLGLGSVESQWRPAFCSAFGDQSLRGIACGGAHTLFLTETGCAYATGLNDFGQLGISDDKSYTTEPLKVCGLPKDIIKISAGYHHSSAITEAAKAVSLPNRVESLTGVTIKMAALGSEHSLAVTDKGEALSWGGGQCGRLGHGHDSSMLGFLRSTSEYTPRLIKKLEGLKVKSIAAGMLHSACIDEIGSVFIFGERAVGKLGLEQEKNATSPSMVSQLPLSEEVACGGYHTCVITSGGELYTWGSNENGCLGIGCTDVSHSPERVQGPFLKHAVCQRRLHDRRGKSRREVRVARKGGGGELVMDARVGRRVAGLAMVDGSRCILFVVGGWWQLAVLWCE